MTSCRRLSFVRRQQVVLGGLVKRMDEPSQESNMSEQGNVLISRGVRRRKGPARPKYRRSKSDVRQPDRVKEKEERREPRPEQSKSSLKKGNARGGQCENRRRETRSRETTHLN